jgi:hypothetical protein
MQAKTKDIGGPLVGQMDTLSPDGSVKSGSARLIVNYVGGRRFPGLRLYGRRDPGGFLNQDIHDQLLGAVGSGGYVAPSGPPVFITQPVPTTVSAHGTAVLFAYLDGARPMTYQWYRDGVAISGETSNVIHIPDVTETHTYWIIATNEFGAAESDHVDVGVNNPEDVMSFYRTRFDHIAEMLASDPTRWQTAEVANYMPEDGHLTIWNIGPDDMLPNGTDRLQISYPGKPPKVAYRTFSRESDSGEVLPGPGQPTYVASTPVTVPSIQDLKDSVFSAPRVTIDSTLTPYTFVRSDLAPDYQAGPDSDENQITNAAGVIYVRWRGI